MIVDGEQQRLTFANYQAAKEFAEAAIREITQNRSNFVTLRGHEAYDYQQAVGLLSSTGLSLREFSHIMGESIRLQPVSERTRHNLRTTLAMLFNFAAAEGSVTPLTPLSRNSRKTLI